MADSLIPRVMDVMPAVPGLLLALTLISLLGGGLTNVIVNSVAISTVPGYVEIARGRSHRSARPGIPFDAPGRAVYH